MNYVSPLEPYLNYEGPVDRMRMAADIAPAVDPYQLLKEKMLRGRGRPGDLPIDYDYLSPGGRGAPRPGSPFTMTRLAGDVVPLPIAPRDTAGMPMEAPVERAYQAGMPRNVEIAPLPMFQNYWDRLSRRTPSR
jgi:hypothetical protein